MDENREKAITAALKMAAAIYQCKAIGCSCEHGKALHEPAEEQFKKVESPDGCRAFAAALIMATGILFPLSMLADSKQQLIIAFLTVEGFRRAGDISDERIAAACAEFVKKWGSYPHPKTEKREEADTDANDFDFSSIKHIEV